MQNGAHSGTLRAMSKTGPEQTVAQPEVYTPQGDNADRSKDGDVSVKHAAERSKPQEIGGPTGPEPTRYGDWERKGRCIDF